ncbi:hypothetical protein HK104_007272 [Borealophlyctis nickersoniae]|nr:hypothetical protein HK104_007272 [Borealophlyctis nickersoniae]
MALQGDQHADFEEEELQNMAVSEELRCIEEEIIQEQIAGLNQMKTRVEARDKGKQRAKAEDEVRCRPQEEMALRRPIEKHCRQELRKNARTNRQYNAFLDQQAAIHQSLRNGLKGSPGPEVYVWDDDTGKEQSELGGMMRKHKGMNMTEGNIGDQEKKRLQKRVEVLEAEIETLGNVEEVIRASEERQRKQYERALIHPMSKGNQQVKRDPCQCRKIWGLAVLMTSDRQRSCNDLTRPNADPALKLSTV